MTSTIRLVSTIILIDLSETNTIGYIGCSAGANLAGFGIYTTNDMPIVHVRSLKALGLVPMCINPHYHEIDEAFKHMGETRDERIHQYHQYGELPVLAIFSDSYVLIQEGSALVQGGLGARVFRKGKEPVDVASGGDLNDLFEPSSVTL